MNLILKNKTTRKILNRYRTFKLLFSKRIKYFGKLLLGKFKDSDIKKPSTIQLPITYKCNFDCVMCGMRTMMSNKDITPNELRLMLKDKLFKGIQNVGLNGGEPFILKNILEYIDVLIDELPKLKHLYIISNGYFTSFILESCKQIKKRCFKRGILFHLSISLDGVGNMQNIMRGNPHAFEKSINTCKEILKEKGKYCDEFNTICTITKINVYNLPEIDVYAKANNIPIAYNVATIHKRLNNDYKYNDFSVFTDEESRKMASEFLYSKFLETKQEMYFARYYYVRYLKRIAACHHRNDVVTVTPNGAISYCAVFSKEIGSGINESSFSLFFNKDNVKYKKELHRQHCETCSHYTESLSREGYKLYFKEIKKEYSLW